MKEERFTIQIPYEPGVKLGLRLDETPNARSAKTVGMDSRLVVQDSSPVLRLAKCISECFLTDLKSLEHDPNRPPGQENGFLLDPRNHHPTHAHTSCTGTGTGGLDLDRVIHRYKKDAIEMAKEKYPSVWDDSAYNYHHYILKAAMVGVIQEFDQIESIQIQNSATKRCQQNGTIHHKHNAFRSFIDSQVAALAIDRTKNALCNEKKTQSKLMQLVVEFTNNPKQYPLTITFLRTKGAKRNLENGNDITHDTTEPKRQTISKQQNSETNNTRRKCRQSSSSKSDKKKNQEEVICILDSSDEETHQDYSHEEFANLHSNSMADQPIPTTPKPLQSPMNPSSIPIAKPDPIQSHFIDAFVYTPYGPGRIRSCHINRNTTYPLMDKGGMINPSITYLIEYPFAIGYIDASCILRLLGSSFTPIPQNKIQSQKSPSQIINRKCPQKIASRFSKSQTLTYNGVSLTEIDQLRLWPLTYVNDNLINFYLKYLQRLECKDEYKFRKKNITNDIFIFPTYFYTRISYFEKTSTGNSNPYQNNKRSRAKLWKDLKGWTKGVDIFKKKYLLIPVNYEQHWSFVLVCHLSDLFQSKRLANGKIPKNGKVPSGKLSDTSESRNEIDEKSLPLENHKEQKNNEGTESMLASSIEDFQIAADAVKSFESITNKIQNNYMIDTNLLLTTEEQKQKVEDDNLGDTLQHNDSNKISLEMPSKPEQSEHQRSPHNNINGKSNAKEKVDSLQSENVEFLPCILHFDSGRHFKLHRPGNIFRHIRKYLFACYEATKVHSQPGYILNGTSLPGYSPAVPVQENTMDCGIYMLEIIERIFKEPPIIKYVCNNKEDKADIPKMVTLDSMAHDSFSYELANKKRNHLLALIYMLQNENI